tara:strand:+ start:143 stop:355 length:213 start_codon:yes stop_codon:yes gene_type:complete
MALTDLLTMVRVALAWTAVAPDGWLVCEWNLGFNIPRLFQMIRGDDSGPGYGPDDIPSSCVRVLLLPQYI